MTQDRESATLANVRYLRQRAELLRRTRDFFDSRGFLEVQPPCLSRECIVDAYLEPLILRGQELRLGDTRTPDQMYLQTSPELAMKRMIAAGAPSIYAITPVFRSGEAGPRHNVEFSMLEWYEVGGSFKSAVQITGQFVCAMIGQPAYDVITYREAFLRGVALDPLEASNQTLLQRLAAEDPSARHTVGDDRDGLLDVLLSVCVAKHLGTRRPTIVTDYPLSQAALAKRSETDERCAARFELFLDGVELANGYDELRDTSELTLRWKANNARRVAAGRRALPPQHLLHEAMETGLPPCSGVALGLDRLLMRIVGEGSIEAVLPFTIFDA